MGARARYWLFLFIIGGVLILHSSVMPYFRTVGLLGYSFGPWGVGAMFIIPSWLRHFQVLAALYGGALGEILDTV